MRHSSTTWKVKTAHRKKLRTDGIHRMVAILRSRVLCISILYVKHRDYNAEKRNLHAVLCGCGTLSLTLNGKYRMGTFENRVITNICIWL